MDTHGSERAFGRNVTDLVGMNVGRDGTLEQVKRVIFLAVVRLCDGGGERETPLGVRHIASQNFEFEFGFFKSRLQTNISRSVSHEGVSPRSRT